MINVVFANTIVSDSYVSRFLFLPLHLDCKLKIYFWGDFLLTIYIYINIILYIAHKSKRKEEFYGGKNVYEMRKANTLEQGKQVGMFQLWLHRKPSV